MIIRIGELIKLLIDPKPQFGEEENKQEPSGLFKAYGYYWL